jgi:hypothetical protein
LSWPSKDDGGEGEFLFGEAELGAKEYLGRPAPGERHEAHAFFEVAVAGQERQSFLNEDLRIEWDEVGLVAVDALVVSGVKGAGFFWLEREIAEALTGAHLPWAQDQVIELDGADREEFLFTDPKIRASDNQGAFIV